MENDYLPDLLDYLINICDGIDEFDGTQLGRLEARLDSLAETAHKARRLCDNIIKDSAK